MFQPVRRRGRPVAPGNLQDGGRTQRETSVCACPRRVESQNHRIVWVGRDLSRSSSPMIECSAAQGADVPGWTVGHLSRTLEAVPDQPGLPAVPQQARVLARVSSPQGQPCRAVCPPLPAAGPCPLLPPSPRHPAAPTHRPAPTPHKGQAQAVLYKT